MPPAAHRFWSRAAKAYCHALEARPLQTQMLSSAALWSAGDLAAQRFERLSTTRERAAAGVDAASRTHLHQLDWQRTAVQTAYASCVWAPVAHYWYEMLDRTVQRVVSPRAGMRFVVAKLVAEMVALHPLSLLAFFGFVGLAQGETSAQVAHQIRRDFAPTLALEWLMWSPLDVANFAVVPVRHQLLIANCGCFVESIALSFVKANGFALPGAH